MPLTYKILQDRKLVCVSGMGKVRVPSFSPTSMGSPGIQDAGCR